MLDLKKNYSDVYPYLLHNDSRSPKPSPRYLSLKQVARFLNTTVATVKEYKKKKRLLAEFRNYKWLEDKTGKLTNKPVDKNNHIIDAVRYATYSILSRPNFGRYAVH